MKDHSSNAQLIPEEGKLDLKQEIRYYLFFWPWFLGAIVIFCAVAFIYLRYSHRVYETEAQIQIKQAESDPASFLTGGLDVFGFDKVNVANDIVVISSYHILSKVVKRLDLQTSVYSKGRVNGYLQFDGSYPFKVKFPEESGPQEWSLNVENGNVVVSANDSLSYSFTKGEVVDNEHIFIEGTDSLFTIDQSYTIVHTTLNSAVASLKKSLTATAESKKGEIINLSISGTNTKRSEAILNTLIDVLAEDQVHDKQEISRVSIDFIDARLEGLSKSIDTISENTITYQMNNDIFDPEKQTDNALEDIIKGQKEARVIGIELEIAKGLRKQIRTQSDYDILPVNVGIKDANLNGLVKSYNDMVLQRNRFLTSATDQSPLVLQLSSQLEKSKHAISAGIDRYIEDLELSLDTYKSMEEQTRNIVKSFPFKGNVLRGFARNFQIVEELYVFLLEKKEEASISYISALPKLKVLSRGVSGQYPISPNGRVIYMGAIFLGLIIPFGIIYILKVLDTKINTREDLEKGLRGVTILGEVPFDEDVKKESDQRSTTAESTRVLRSSLSFLIKKQPCTVINVTSTTKGEGKSFVSYNLAASYKALGMNVIMLGADLRNPQLHNRIGIKRPQKGLSTFLSDPTFNDIDAIITKGAGKQEMDYLLSGAIPPNPAELLAGPRMQEIIELLKEKYEMIIIDSAPLMLVSDTKPILPLCDVVVYVVRAQYSDKNIFPFIQELVENPSLPSFGLVLNGLITRSSSSYNYRYRYNYSYNYGYGYGYGSDEEKSTVQ